MFTGALYFKMVNLKHAWHIQLYTVMTESQVFRILQLTHSEKIMNFSVTYSYQANKVARKKNVFASTATVGTCIYYHHMDHCLFFKKGKPDMFQLMHSLCTAETSREWKSTSRVGSHCAP